MAGFIEAKAVATLEESGLLDETAPTPRLERTLSELALDGCVVDGVLSHGECQRLLERAECAGFSFWDPAGPTDARRSLRNADTLECRSPALCDELWRRLTPFVPPSCQISPEQERFESDLGGVWKVCEIDPPDRPRRQTPQTD